MKRRNKRRLVLRAEGRPYTQQVRRPSSSSYSVETSNDAEHYITLHTVMFYMTEVMTVLS